MRNFFHDKVSVLYNNDIVNYEFFRLVYKLDTSAENTGLRTCAKVTAAHIDPTSFQRMNARLAFQLFSNSMANAIKFYRDTNCEGFVGSEKTESFIRDMNDLVDALNSSIPTKGLYSGSASHHILLKVLQIRNSESNTFASERTLESLRITLKSTLEVLLGGPRNLNMYSLQNSIRIL